MQMFTKAFTVCIVALSIASVGIVFYEFTANTLGYTYDSFSQVQEEQEK
jgi:hypothetical protein